MGDAVRCSDASGGSSRALERGLVMAAAWLAAGAARCPHRSSSPVVHASNSSLQGVSTEWKAM